MKNKIKKEKIVSKVLQNTANIKIVDKYLEYVHNKLKRKAATLDSIRTSIICFEKAIGFIDFKEYTPDWQKTFKDYLDIKENYYTGRAFSQSTYVNYSGNVRRFFKWLQLQNGYKSLSKFDFSDFYLEAK